MVDFISQQRLHPTGAPSATIRSNTRITLWEMNMKSLQPPGINFVYILKNAKSN